MSLSECYYIFNYKDHWDPGLFYMFTHYFNNRWMVLYILTCNRVLSIVCLDQLYGACHTHISYHNMARQGPFINDVTQNWLPLPYSVALKCLLCLYLMSQKFVPLLLLDALHHFKMFPCQTSLVFSGSECMIFKPSSKTWKEKFNFWMREGDRIE